MKECSHHTYSNGRTLTHDGGFLVCVGWQLRAEPSGAGSWKGVTALATGGLQP